MSQVQNVRRRGEGRWEARYRDPNGRRRGKTFKTKQDAINFLRTVQADVVRGQWVDPNRGKTKFKHWADRWYDTTAARKPKTRAGYRDLLKRLVLPRFGRMELGKIRPIDVTEWVTDLQARGLSASRIRQAYRVVAMVMRSAVENDYIAKTPCTSAVSRRLPRDEPRERHFLTADQVAAVAGAAGEPHAEYELLVLFLAYTGLRWGEAAALRRKRVDLLRGRILVRESVTDVGGRLHFGQTKTYKSREVPLPRFLREMLARHLEDVPADPDAFVFTAPRGGTLRVNNWRKRTWKRALEKVNLPTDVRIHDLRHTCASLLISQGAHPKAIQATLGHSSVSVTLDVYGHLFPDDLDRLADGLDATYRGARSETRPPLSQGLPRLRFDSDLGAQVGSSRGSS